ncbi:hypothetical protein GCM10023196_069210 [Actinoallomurus vinaceus]|uniref:Uncharacterized protein n=1 Tax=Actinoallomurus vinaceus TaxID=1080074 RepID=A0ABP8UJE3_9ACTN
MSQNNHNPAADGGSRKEPASSGSGGRSAMPDLSAGVPLRGTPTKGLIYEHSMHEVLESIASDLGDTYADTSTKPGRIKNCKKGDGLLTVADQPGVPAGTARVVIEMSDADRHVRDWPDCLEQCERNRGAQSSLGLVRHISQVPGGRRIPSGKRRVRVYGARRFVVAFDPEVDEVSFLHAVIAMLRSQAVHRAARSGMAHLATAQEKLAHIETLTFELTKLQAIAERARVSATKLVADIGVLHSNLAVTLAEARSAVGEVAHATPTITKNS